MLAHNPAIARLDTKMYVAESKRLTHQGARTVMATAIDMASGTGIAISCAVVEADGHVIVLERMDAGRFHTLHSCTTKAVCAASNRRRLGDGFAHRQAAVESIGASWT